MNPVWTTRLARLAFCAVLLVILVAGLRSNPVPEAFSNQDKLHHWAGFACLTVSAWLAFPRTPFLWLMLGPLATSVGIELVQGLEPLRTASWGDMLANGVGVLSGILAILVMRRHWVPAQAE
ncbi:VanZ family protein [Pseudomonas sp. CR3202]|uniref:VanZ family protein n=1 Tax=Pseudomonas sp. CR3202 TaxID=3351532 RepID=UPI003BF3A126